MELILFAMVSLVVIVAVLASRLNDNSFPFPFDRKTAIFTPAEKNFQNLVEQAMGANYRVLNRVKLSDVVTIRNGVSPKASQSAAKSAEKKYVDFVLCERSSMKLLGVIDLVDTQGKGYKVKKDWFVSGALEAASIPHLRIKVKANYTVEEIRSCINTRLISTPTPEPKMKGKIIPAPMIRVRSKDTGVLTPAAARSQLESLNKSNTTRQIPAPKPSIAALPH